MPTRIHTQRLDHARLYAYISTIMPKRICTRRRDHAHVYMLKWAQSCPRVYAHIGARVQAHIGVIMPTRSARLREIILRLCAHIRAIMPARVCTHRRDHAHVHVHS
jgi:hypothetical protein